MPKTPTKSVRASRSGSLDAYRAKRDFSETSEPSGKSAKPVARLRFVVQKHHASRLHYDFRLEAGGVLASWAVPKGPTLATGVRRLAMHVEDHPLDYRDFEGTIPSGQYGAGSVIVWDRGTYRLAEGSDPVQAIADGKIKFIMSGKKLRGMFTLVKIAPRASEQGDPWLLIKDHDEHVDLKYDAEAHSQSVKSGKTLDEIGNDPRAKTWQSKPKSKPQPKAKAKAEPLPHIGSPMLATPVDAPFDDPDWLFEIKWDGYRAICTIEAEGKISLRSRTGGDLLKTFPALRDLRDAFNSLPIIVDGEIVSLDSRGHSDFQRLQQYADSKTQLTYVAFDVLYADGRDLRKEPLEDRKELLARLIIADSIAMYSKHIVGKGKALYESARRNHLEGIIAKKRSSTYRERRTRDWMKIKAAFEQEFVIGGWTQPRGSRKGFGALLLGVYDGKTLRYAGHVGTGFSTKTLAEIHATLKKLERATSPFADEIEASAQAHFVKPQLVAEVRFAEWTRDDRLRQPVFLGLRIDKKPHEAVREKPIRLPKP